MSLLRLDEHIDIFLVHIIPLRKGPQRFWIVFYLLPETGRVVGDVQIDQTICVLHRLVPHSHPVHQVAIFLVCRPEIPCQHEHFFCHHID